MEKKGIFAKIDELYTNATKVIIGDMPLDSSPEAETKVKSNASTKKKSLKEKFDTVKNNLLNLGKPNDGKSLLYDEVVKREKQENKEAKKDKIKTKSIPAKKKVATTKKSTPSKDVEKKSETKETAKNTKATPTKKKTDTAKKVPTKKVTTPKTSPEKDVKKKTIKVAVSTSKTNDTTKTEDKKTPTKKSTTKKTGTEAKKSVANKAADDKKTSSKKASVVPRGAKKAAKIALYIQDIKKHYGEVDEAFVAIIVKNLGPSIYKTDAELVSCSDPKELETVRKNFLVKKLGIDASKGVLDAAIQDVCTELKGVRRKYRATFYYALAKKFKKESVLS